MRLFYEALLMEGSNLVVVSDIRDGWKKEGDREELREWSWAIGRERTEQGS
jgi:hypothetical protein